MKKVLFSILVVVCEGLRAGDALELAAGFKRKRSNNGLFGDDDDSEEEVGDAFRVREAFEGKSGAKNLAIQMRVGNDSR